MDYFSIIILSIILPGSGHFFIEKYKSGLIIFSILILLDTLFFQFLLSKYIWFIIYFIIFEIVRIFAIIDAILKYKKDEIFIFKKNKIISKSLIGIIIFFIIIYFNTVYHDFGEKYFRFRPNVMSSSVMTNTIMLDDKIIVDYNKYYKNNIQLGDIIVYKYRGRNSVSRCLGLVGDKIQIMESNVIINDIMLDEPYKNLDQKELEKASKLNIYKSDFDLSETIVSENYIFIISDNRYNSSDRRFTGQFSKDFVLGKVLYIYSSKNKVKIGRNLN